LTITAPSTFTLENTCTCDYEAECAGWCYDDGLQYLSDMIDTWLDRNGMGWGDEVIIEGTGMGWLRQSGTAVCTAQNIVNTLSLNGEWKLAFTIGVNDFFTATRYSHDEPTGASFVIAPVPEAH
jgi:hypothetical protein